MESQFRLFPPQASTMAGPVDQVFFFLLAISAFFTLLILALIVYFALRYRRRSKDDPAPAEIKTSYKLEITWTAIPFVIAMVIFAWGAKLYVRMFDPPPDAMEIYVIGKQWMWKIQHPEGRREINELHVPLGRPIKLTLGSQDAIHDFFIPAFRVKHDVIPGRFVQLWFEPTQLGEFHFFCSQYCGTGHSQMIGTVVVMDPAAYQAWLSGTTADEPPAVAGERLFTTFGCVTCHGQRAPTLAGLYGTPVTLDDGSTVIADDNYLRRSILDSTAQIVAGYQPIMPSYRGQLSEDQLVELIAYMKSLKNTSQESVRKP